MRARAYRTAEGHAGTLLLAMLALVLLMAVSWGQACQRAYQQGVGQGTADAMVEAEQRGYERGYAAAVYEYQEGGASWAD